MQESTYILEIYEPASTKDVLNSFRSPTPFMGIHTGDRISTAGWGIEPSRGTLRVTAVEHIVLDHGDYATHKCCVFTA